MKKLLLLLFVMGTLQMYTQELRLKKGVVMDAIKVSDSLSESFSLFIPSNFDTNKKWPILFVFNFNGKEKQVMRLLAKTAENRGYILAASNNLKDSLSVSENVQTFSKAYNTIISMLPINNNQIFAVGFNRSARLALTMPVFINNIAGVLSYNSPISNVNILNVKKPFQYVGIVSKGSFNYLEMLRNEKELNKLKFPNELLVFDENQEWPTEEVLDKAFLIFTLSTITKSNIPKLNDFITENFEKSKVQIQQYIVANKLNKAEDLITETISMYKPFKDIELLKEEKKRIKKTKIYKSLKRAETNVFFKEKLLKDDYDYYLEEDIYTYNFNNLGWWTYQIQEIEKFKNSPNVEQQQMGLRLEAYIKALVEDNLDIIFLEKKIDNDALSFLWMLKTIISPKNYEVYLKLISHSSNNNDFGTSLFYLEELLKNGYTDVDKLYNLEHTTLLRISPEYNQIIEKYLKKGRYLIKE